LVMPREMIEYRHEYRHAARFPVLRTTIFITTCVLFVVSIIWCIATWSSPDRFIFLPYGDVGLGFRSHGGFIQWVQHAPWMANPDHVRWSLPWVVGFAFEASVIVLCILPRRRAGAA
jgi:hypothetical protein